MKTHTGFTLIEVLIAMLILAGGLLGLAALQTYTLRSNLAAYNHGQATQLLYNMADRMRANNCKPASSPPAPTAVTCNAIAPNYVIANSNSLTGQSVDAACVTTGCTPLVMANNDLIEWNDAIRTTLSLGRGSISSANGIFTLSITWDEDRSDVIDGNDPTFTMSLQL
jgi:type IV pilus assembly protein PilV